MSRLRSAVSSSARELIAARTRSQAVWSSCLNRTSHEVFVAVSAIQKYANIMSDLSLKARSGMTRHLQKASMAAKSEFTGLHQQAHRLVPSTQSLVPSSESYGKYFKVARENALRFRKRLAGGKDSIRERPEKQSLPTHLQRVASRLRRIFGLTRISDLMARNDMRLSSFGGLKHPKANIEAVGKAVDQGSKSRARRGSSAKRDSN